MEFNSLIQLKRERFDQLERDIADPALFSNRQRAKAIMREHASIKQLLAKWDELEAARKQLDDNRELAMSGDVEIAAIADDEIPDLEKRVAISNAKFRSRCCRRTKMRPAMPSWKSEPERAEAKRPFSPPTCTGCIIAMQNLPV
jgi:protein subunit release factor A